VVQLVRYLNQTDYNQLLVEAMDLLQQLLHDFELSWMYFGSWCTMFKEPFEDTEDSITVNASSPLSIDDFSSYPEVDVVVNQREYDLGWRIRRMCRSVDKNVDRRMSRIENEARVLSPIWSDSMKRVSSQNSVQATDEDNYWGTVYHFFLSLTQK
jgi:hypothetical protein